MKFTARIITGAGRGKGLGVPTLNLDLRDVPQSLGEGVFACWTVINGETYHATMHNGPRPTFDDSRSCEVHLLDHTLDATPATVSVEAVTFLRSIAKYPSAEALSEQMKEDIIRARDILSA